MNRHVVQHQEIDLRPCTGWRVFYLDDETGLAEMPMVGWLIQAGTVLDAHSFEEVENQPPLTERDRRIVAAVVDPTSGYVEAADEYLGSFWLIIAPGQEGPSDAEAVKERAARAARHQAKA